MIKTRQNIYWFLFLFSSHFLPPSFPFHIKNYFQNKRVGLEQAYRCSRSRCILWPLTLPVEQLTATIEQEVVPSWSPPHSSDWNPRSRGQLPNGPPQPAPPSGQSLFFITVSFKTHIIPHPKDMRIALGNRMRAGHKKGLGWKSMNSPGLGVPSGERGQLQRIIFPHL